MALVRGWSQRECAPAQWSAVKSISCREISLFVLLLLDALTFLTALGLSGRLVDGEPVVQAADALRLGEAAAGLGVTRERGTAAQASCLAVPASTYQEPAVGADVPTLLPGVLAVAKERLLALRLAGRENRTRRCRPAPEARKKKEKV